MRSDRTLVPAVTVLVFLSMGRVAYVQSSPSPFGADVFIGGVPRPDQPKEGEAIPAYPRMGGWQVGASLRRGRRLQWLGLTASYGSHSNDQVRVRETLGGLRVTSPWLIGGDSGVRGFLHALTGYTWSGTASAAAEHAPAFVLGGGFDVVFFRVQVDYVHTRLTGVPENSARGFIGGVLPICFTGCRPEWQDGIPLSHAAQGRRLGR